LSNIYTKQLSIQQRLRQKSNFHAKDIAVSEEIYYPGVRSKKSMEYKNYYKKYKKEEKI